MPKTLPIGAAMKRQTITWKEAWRLIVVFAVLGLIGLVVLYASEIVCVKAIEAEKMRERLRLEEEEEEFFGADDLID